MLKKKLYMLYTTWYKNLMLEQSFYVALTDS